MRYLVAFVCVLFFAMPVFAQTPPDILIQTDGSTVRGTVMQSIPGESVIFVNFLGETLVIPWAQVEYAGPAEERPTQPIEEAPQPDELVPPSLDTTTPEPQTTTDVVPAETSLGASELVTIEFTSTPSGVTFEHVGNSHYFMGTSNSGIGFSLQRLCTAPCTMELRPGEYPIVASYRGTHAVAYVRGPQVFNSDSRLHAVYVNRRGRRTAGWTIMSLGLVAGSVGCAPFGSDQYGLSDYTAGNVAMVSTGVVLSIVGMVYAISGRNRVGFSLTPL